MIPASTSRVPEKTVPKINRAIRLKTRREVRNFAEKSAGEIENRLAELEQEWDTERLLEANAAALAFTGSLLALSSDRRWLAVPLVVTGFLLQHAVQGWCPPLPLIRRLGFRTRSEIDRERYALKAVRGDFGVRCSSDEALRAVFH